MEDLEEIDYQLLKRCHELFYNPGRMVLVISGDLDAKELYHHVAKNQDQKKFPALPAIRYEIPRQDGDVESPARTADMEVARPMLCLGLKDKVARDWKESIHDLASLLLEIFIGKNSSFYNRLYDDGIIDNTFGVEYTCTPWYSHFIFGGESDNPEHLANELLTELSRLRDCGISQQLVDINLRKLMGLFIMDLNGLESTVMAYATDWLQQSEYLARFEDMRKLTKREVEEFLYSLDLKKTCLSVVKPLE